MRLDGFTGFQIGEGWYGSVGGFYRTSDGVRDPQFTADEGGQLTATLKRESDRGQFILYARYLDDKNQFITPIPVIQRGTRQFQRLSGFRSARLRLTTARPFGASDSTAIRTAAPTPILPMAAARRCCSSARTSTTSSTTAGRSATSSSPMAATSIPTRCSPAAIPPRSSTSLYTIPTNLGGFGLPPGSATATFVGGGAVAPDQDVIHQGWWFIHKELQQHQQRFSLEQGTIRGQHADDGPVSRLLRDGR